MDIGTVVVGDLHRKNICVSLRLGEVQKLLLGLRATQWSLFNCGFNLEDPIDDVAPDVPLTRLSIGEFPPSPTLNPWVTPNVFWLKYKMQWTLWGLTTLPCPHMQRLMVKIQCCPLHHPKRTCSFCHCQLFVRLPLFHHWGSSWRCTPTIPSIQQIYLRDQGKVFGLHVLLHWQCPVILWFLRQLWLLFTEDNCVTSPTLVLQAKTPSCPIRAQVWKTSRTLRQVGKKAIYPITWLAPNDTHMLRHFRGCWRTKVLVCEEQGVKDGGGQTVWRRVIQDNAQVYGRSGLNAYASTLSFLSPCPRFYFILITFVSYTKIVLLVLQTWRICEHNYIICRWGLFILIWVHL